TFLEQYEIRRAYGSYVVGGVQPVIAPRGEAKPNEEVFAALGRAMGWQHDPFLWGTEIYMQKIAETLTLDRQPADLSIWKAGRSQRYNFPGERPIQFETVFPRTADSKVHLTPATLGKTPFHYQPIEQAQFPLALVSPSNSKMITSTL